MMWVQRHPRYFDHAKAKFATGADGWLVACARVRDATVVTNEQSAPESRKEIRTGTRGSGLAAAQTGTPGSNPSVPKPDPMRR